MRVLELFAGYGSQAFALENLGIDFTSDISEIDTYAIKAYNQLHGETHNWGDITKIDETKLPYYDLITYSSPCQDFSVAGLGKGGDEGSGTRSSLLWECERIIRAVKPKYLLMENVKNLVGKKHVHNFNRWLKTLEMMGYWNFWQVLNAKDYGVPQNRERVFVVSILGGGHYLFPNKIKLEKRLKDILEPVVDEKYYLSDKMIKFFIENSENNAKKGNGFRFTPQFGENYARAVTTNAGSRMDDNFIKEPLACASRGRNPENSSDRTAGCPTEQRLEINNSGCSNTLTSVQKDNWVIEPLAYDEQNGYIRKDGCVGTLTTDGSSPKHNNRVIEPLRIKEATSKGYVEAYEWDSINLEQPNSKTRRGRVGKQVAQTLTCSCNQGVVEPKVINPLKDKTEYGWHFEQEVYDENGLARAVKAGGGSGNIPKVIQVGNIVSTGNWDNPQRGRIYSANGCSPALNTMQGGGLEPKIVTYDIPQTVSVRKYDVDEVKLVALLRDCKQKSGLTNNQLAEKLNLPLTMVEHWFRLDNYFAIPSADIWSELKKVLGITTDEFDKSITEFEEKEGVFEKTNRCYGTDGIAPTITSASADEKIITNKIIEVSSDAKHQQDLIQHQDGICRAIPAGTHGSTPHLLKTVVDNYRIRKLTPRECWRLMGVKDEQYDKLHDISNTQLYKMAGNSIVVDVLMGIFRNMFLNDNNTKGQLELSLKIAPFFERD